MFSLNAWLAATMSGMQPDWPSDAGFAVDELIAEASKQGIVALVHWQLKQARHEQCRSSAPEAVCQAFSVAARNEALLSMMQQSEARRLLGLMADIGIPGLLLKGSALAYWAYAAPHLRACGDIDLLVPSLTAAHTLADRLSDTAGYELFEVPGDTGYEFTCRRCISDTAWVEVDMHWGLVNSPLFAQGFSFDELMLQSIALPALAPNARGLGPVHAFIHACLHRAVNLSLATEDTLKWLYDLHLLAQGFAPADWQQLLVICKEKGFAGVCLVGLEAAAVAFRPVLPADVAQALRKAQLSESLDVRRLSDWRYIQRKNLQALPTWRHRMRWLIQRLLPSRDYLQDLYGSEHQSYAALMVERCRRAMRRVRT